MRTLKKQFKKKFIFYIFGLMALIWFLIRVIPKPVRASYPCQRAAFPMASAFVLWLCGLTLSYLSFKKAGQYFKDSRYRIAALFFLVAIVMAVFINIQSSIGTANASNLGAIKSLPAIVQAKFHISSIDSVIKPISKVGIVQSSKSKATEIGYDEIKNMVREAVSLAGGFDSIINKGSTVLIKPNLVVSFLDSPAPKYLYPDANGVTTDWRIVKAVVELVREINPDGKVYIAEGSADNTRDNFTKLKYTKENIPGVDEFIAFEESGGWEEWNAAGLVSVTLPNGKGLYANSLKPNKSNEFYLNKIYFEADVVISMPMLKNHKDAGITGAVKNVGIGATPQNIYGGAKGVNARWLNQRINHDWDNLHKWIHDFYLCRQVDFVIMDGLQGLMDGPAGGWKPLESIQQNMRLILASKDAVAIDAISALIMGFDPQKVPHLDYLSKDSVGCINPSYIGVEGKKVHEVRKILGFTDQSVGGNMSVNKDFTPPIISVNNYNISDESVSIDLNTDNQVVKVEISIDNIFIDSIFIKNYNNLILKTAKTITNPKQVKIYAYDKFLNCTNIHLDGSLAGMKLMETEHLMKVYPNPFENILNIELNKKLSGETNIYIYDMSGKNISRFSLKGISSKTLDLSYLQKGTYLLVSVNNKTVDYMNIIKK